MIKRRVALFGAAVCLLSHLGLFAGTTGKLTGQIMDAGTKSPLPGAVVLLEGTPYGGVAEIDGHYLVLNLPPGIYTARARLLGYKDLRVENVRVSVDLTTEIDFPLESTIMDIGESVTVTAKRSMVVKDLTASTAVVGADEMSAMPVTEVSDAVELQAGLVKDSGGNLHVRGGRKGEISYWIDGVPVTDVYDGGTIVDVNKDMVQELQVISGAFNAEYGQAMSGIVNITTKEGSNQFGGSVTAYSGDHLSTHDGIFTHIKSVNPFGTRNVEASIQGPVVKDKLFFFLNARTYGSDGWLFGQRRYNPSAVTMGLTMPDSLMEQYAPEYMEGSRALSGNNRGFQYVLGSNTRIDSIITWNNLDAARRANPDSFNAYYQKFRRNHQNGKGDGKYVPMNWNDKLYGQAKLIWRLTPTIKIAYNAIYDGVRYQDYERDYTLNPDGELKRFRTGQTHILQVTQALSGKTFFKLGLSYFSKKYQNYMFESVDDPGYVHPDLGLQQSDCFKTGGMSDNRFMRNTETLLGKFDIESQLSRTHLVKTGIEVRRHKLYQENFTLRPGENQTGLNLIFDNPHIDARIMPDSTIYSSRYTHSPLEFSAYIQDKMEFKEMIVNLGVRLDLFRPDGMVLADPSDPSIYSPIKPQNRYHDWGTDGIPNTHDPDGTESNGMRDTGEQSVTLAEREQYWFKKATTKVQIGPRLGVSFPITDRGVIHFSYGHFFQIPRFERLYQNPDFELSAGTGNIGVVGNTDLQPEQTVSGELGLQQQLTDDIFMSVTGFFRDVRNLAGTSVSEQNMIFGGSATYSKIVNGDFGFIRGVTLSMNKRFSGGLSASVDYTFQIAKGSNSDPEAARNAIAGGKQPEVQLTSLDWDQRHTINASVSYSARTYGGSVILQWGSGLPFTPRASQDITTLMTNNQMKPSTVIADLRVYKDIRFGKTTLTVFARVFNLFDALNEINVYNDTGRAGFTADEQRDLKTNPPEYINTVQQWYTNSSFYSEPRRVEIGATLGL
jgi:outer membrane receptor for ferrienterochelin and colicin